MLTPSIWLVVDLALFGLSPSPTPANQPPPPPPPAAVCHEDMPCWDPATMGNRCWTIQVYNEDLHAISSGDGVVTQHVCADDAAREAYGRPATLAN
jgi:hypothetical protein